MQEFGVATCKSDARHVIGDHCSRFNYVALLPNERAASLINAWHLFLVFAKSKGVDMLPHPPMLSSPRSWGAL